MKIYNTMSRQKEEFQPLEAGKLKLYACGPTVYNYFHIGNARAFVVFDVLRRYFEHLGYEVTYVQNITDIDDRIIQQSIEEGISFHEVAAKYTRAYFEDCAALGLKPPTVQPKATDVMPEIINLIDKLVQQGNAYESAGDVYFSTESLPEYGALSGKKLDEQLTGARVEENIQKRHPADFTLWKKSKPGEPVWQSPWGEGRPGWHSECVVMSQKYLGDTFDIHGGGIDLVFPHHENELAQATAITGKPLANYWMHNGFLNIDGEKMSKSLKNFFTAREILAEYPAEAIRFFFLSKHYRSPIDFNREVIEESDRAVKNLYASLKSILTADFRETEIEKAANCLSSEFDAAMNDDMNTAKAIAVLFELAKSARNENLHDEIRRNNAFMLIKLGRVLGFFQNLKEQLSDKTPDLSKQLIDLIIQYRMDARAAKDWTASDRIRDDLAKLGVELKDSREGSTWTIKEK